MKGGSFFLLEMRRMMSSLSPRGAASVSTSVTNPYWYSRPVRFSIVFLSVLSVMSDLDRPRRDARPDGFLHAGEIGTRSDHLGEADLAERLGHGLVDALPGAAHGAAGLELARPDVAAAAFGERERALERLEDL